ncbi:HAD-IIB family hydrolase [Spiroplasma endosymbiont of Crioceris asparagi]|uniref:HAD-IIB family hydrolase n=1 Tax=Spiroplasma endosymbiont of Crioceris asparagi TaxID=3066286 RepID=UPI0030D06C03
MKLKDKKLKRLIMVDLDGTILKSGRDEMHPNTKRVLINARKNGHDVCIITGRPFRASEKIYNELGLSTLMCNFDGAHIHHPNSSNFNRIILPISEDIIFQILNDDLIKTSISNLIIESYKKTMIMKHQKDLMDFFHISLNEKECVVANPYDEWIGPSTNIVLFLHDEKDRDIVLNRLKHYENSIKVSVGNVYGAEGNEHATRSMITLTNKLIDKGIATKIIAQFYNKDIREVIAFGDQMNDYEMIQTVGYGVVMKNGNFELKKVGGTITELTNDEGGVGHTLEKLLKGEEL